MVENCSSRICSSHFMKENLGVGGDLISNELHIFIAWLHIYLYSSDMCSYYFVSYFSHLKLVHVNLSMYFHVSQTCLERYFIMTILLHSQISLSLVALFWIYKLLFLRDLFSLRVVPLSISDISLKIFEYSFLMKFLI